MWVHLGPIHWYFFNVLNCIAFEKIAKMWFSKNCKYPGNQKENKTSCFSGCNVGGRKKVVFTFTLKSIISEQFAIFLLLTFGVSRERLIVVTKLGGPHVGTKWKLKKNRTFARPLAFEAS